MRWRSQENSSVRSNLGVTHIILGNITAFHFYCLSFFPNLKFMFMVKAIYWKAYLFILKDHVLNMIG